MMTSYNLPRNYDVGAHYQQYGDPETKAVVNATFGALSSYFHTRDTQLQQRNENSLLSDIILRAKNNTVADEGSIKANYNYYAISSEKMRWCGTGANYGPSGSEKGRLRTWRKHGGQL